MNSSPLEERIGRQCDHWRGKGEQLGAFPRELFQHPYPAQEHTESPAKPELKRDRHTHYPPSSQVLSYPEPIHPSRTLGTGWKLAKARVMPGAAAGVGVRWGVVPAFSTQAASGQPKAICQNYGTF